MSEARRSGFILVYVIMLLAITAVVMLVLTEGANTMLFQADATYLQALDRNLAASGLAWARHQAARGEPATAGPLSLDASLLGDSRAVLAVEIAMRGDAAECRIETSAAKGRQSISKARQYVLSAR
ncbi:hypothetical protein [Anaerobaca lacustris]|uniref:Uncharacterized protein n=1 Tax=Anaerobaca lacustris TaxID=3044600 RepID=A0AAW6U1U2_9BACT|nr:hypothetical protein [Sedimentisphaerales bacterium M17dextr]